MHHLARVLVRFLPLFCTLLLIFNTDIYSQALRSSSQQKVAPPPAKKIKTTKATIIDSEDDESVDELSPSKPAPKKFVPVKNSALQTKAPQSRSSLSSLSTMRNSAESSRYSTPGTSLAATPAAGLTEIRYGFFDVFLFMFLYVLRSSSSSLFFGSDCKLSIIRFLCITHSDGDLRLPFTHSEASKIFTS